MGGYRFTTELESGVQDVDYLNLPGRGWWSEAIIAAGETAVLDSAHCPFDKDGECFRRGCLQDQIRGREMPIKEFLQANERTLAFVKAHPEKLRVEQVVFSPDPDRNEYRPGAELSIPLLESLIDSIKNSVAKGAKVVYMWDRLSDPDLYPCPRELLSCRPPNAEEIDEHLKRGWPIPSQIIESRFLPYDEAVEKRKSGEWERNQDEVWSYLASNGGLSLRKGERLRGNQAAPPEKG